MRLLILFLFSAQLLSAQNLSYSPGLTLENTVSLNYYDTEYIFFKNIGTTSLNLSFEIVEEIVPTEWAASGCTNVLCYVSIPQDGLLGDVNPGEEAYLSINLSVNDFPGDATIRFRIFDHTNPVVNDTIAFIFHAESDTIELTPQPWVKTNFYQNVLTVFLKNDAPGTILKVFDLSGKLVIFQELQIISSFSFRELESEVYIIMIENKSGQQFTQKIFNGS